ARISDTGQYPASRNIDLLGCVITGIQLLRILIRRRCTRAHTCQRKVDISGAVRIETELRRAVSRIGYLPNNDRSGYFIVSDRTRHTIAVVQLYLTTRRSSVDHGMSGKIPVIDTTPGSVRVAAYRTLVKCLHTRA